jgi:NADPH:quinone reductase
LKAIQIVELTGPSRALRLVELPAPEPSHTLTPGEGVLIDVHAAGVSCPEVLQTRGEYPQSLGRQEGDLTGPAQRTASAQSRRRPANCGVAGLTSTTASAGTFALRAAAKIASGDGAS